MWDDAMGDKYRRVLLLALWVPVMQLGSVTVAHADAPRTGIYRTSFDQTTPLAGGVEVFKRTLHPMALADKLAQYNPPTGSTIDPTQETWQIYVPEDYDGNMPYGVLVWVDPWDGAAFPNGWQGMLKDHHLIYVSAAKSGNDQSVPMRRVPLALTGLVNIEARYKIDPERIYVGGFSGGGVTASVIAASYADVFTGGIFVATSYGLGTDNLPVPPLDRYHLMQTRGRYVFLVGTEDPVNEAITNRATSAYHDLCVLRVRRLSMLNRGHTDVSSRYLTSALNYLDSPPDVKADDQSACEKQLQARRANAVAAVSAALAADDHDAAEARLVDLHRAFGPLAEPEFSRFSNCLAGSQPLKACVQNLPDAH